MGADPVADNQRQTMLRGWRRLLAWEIAVTVLTVVMTRQDLALAVTVTVIDPAAIAQTQPVAKTRSTCSEGHTRRRASVNTRLGAAALVSLVGATVAVAVVL